MNDPGILFGRGVGFPFRLGEEGRVPWSVGPENVRQSIRIILLTEPGERVMLPSFGAGLKRFLFEPNTTVTHRLIEEAVVTALKRWEPRIRAEEVLVRADPEDGRAVSVSIRYGLIADRSREELQLKLQLRG